MGKSLVELHAWFYQSITNMVRIGPDPDRTLGATILGLDLDSNRRLEKVEAIIR